MKSKYLPPCMRSLWNSYQNSRRRPSNSASSSRNLDEIHDNQGFRKALVVLATEDPRLQPFVDLLNANDDPDVDHTEDIKRALDELRRTNERELAGKDTKQNTPILSASPFSELRNAGFHVSDDEVQSVDFVGDPEFHNWGFTVKFKPSWTLVVRSINGVCQVVKWASQTGRKVRVAGFRHTWTELYGNNGDIMIMFLPIETLVKLPYELPPKSWSTELSGIEVVPAVVDRVAPPGHAFVKIMAGTSNDQLRQWSFDNKAWCMPFNVIMVEVTLGGTNAVICHGSGFSTSTLSDLVAEICYVDARGTLQSITDPDELRAASGSFGLLGVVTSVTLQLDAMGVAELVPTKLSLPLAIPPPKGYPIPEEIQKMIKKEKITDSQLEQARLNFIQRCEEDYYLEWFWFPYEDTVWVNTWKRRDLTANDMDLKPYPDTGLDGVTSQNLQEDAAEIITTTFLWKALPAYWQARLLAIATMAILPSVKSDKDAIVTYVSEALHFRRGIQNFRCWDSEWEVPIGSINGQRDYETIQRAWWDGLSSVYSRSKEAPMRLTFEMRLMGCSNVLLAPQRGNTQGTISIEMLTTLATPQDEWASFIQLVADKWTNYNVKDDSGKLLYPRPHWAKQWSGLRVHGKPIEQYLKEDAYGSAFAEFKASFQNILTKRGLTVDETRARFGNTLLDGLIFD
ncbi:uncharacterized protein FIBRA_04895 [Fibroporia radiculosa]|uniref:FAD-binding PCMH-type domain-containing protein n=1 Tax=Fibroporia radiculosa TaxID=599839 RepID=J4IAE8_9APHY|nr:uncharacterized protein FIBRA_04895 [Fibroporia radiculosa]CCM02786.1 predicted protein [Fibroporia radiculosa]